jgi:hypothetical protein
MFAQCSLYEAALYSTTRMEALESAKSKGKLQGLARQMIALERKKGFIN